MATFTSAALIVASAALGFYLIRWGFRGVQKVRADVKEIQK